MEKRTQGREGEEGRGGGGVEQSTQEEDGVFRLPLCEVPDSCCRSHQHRGADWRTSHSFGNLAALLAWELRREGSEGVCGRGS